MFVTHSVLRSLILAAKVSIRVMHVKDVFSPLFAIAFAMDEYLLREEADRICNLHPGFICEGEAIGC